MTERRLLIFGWDGADLEVIREGWRRGMLQNLRSLAESGQHGVLTSTIPAVTSVAWTSFLTGTEPGEHGIFGFRRVDPASYRQILQPGGARRVPTLMHRLDSHGYRTTSVMVPWTYPPEDLSHGAVIPGWDAPRDSFDSCHPKELMKELPSIVERIPHGSPPRSGSKTFLARQAENLLLRARLNRHVIRRYDPHVAMTVFCEPDQVAHRLWNQDGLPDVVLDAYEQVDRTMGSLLEDIGRPDDLVAVVSDHGSGPVHTHIHIAQLLAAGGWLQLNENGGNGRRLAMARQLKKQLWLRLPPWTRNSIVKRGPRKVLRRMARAIREDSIDWEKTLAFPVGDEVAEAGVRIHTKPFTRATVSEERYEVVKQELATYLAGIRDPTTALPVFSGIHGREELYEGPYVGEAADLWLIPAAGYAAQAGLDFTAPFSRVAIGGHRRDGMYLVNDQAGMGEREPIGGFLPQLLTQAGYAVTQAPDAGGYEPSSEPLYGQEEAQEIEERLRDLGYID